MPTYEYACKTCGHRFETWQKMIDDPLTTCPTCGAHIHRVLFPAGVVFKGSGFYKTDHRDSASVASSAKDEQPSGDSSKSAPSDGDSSANSSKSSSTESGSNTNSSSSSPATESKPATTSTSAA